MKKEILFGFVAVLMLFAIGGTLFVKAGSTPKVVSVSTLQAFPANLQPVTMIEAWNILVKNSRIRDGCDELPTLAEVEQVVEEHQSLIREIEKVNPGFISVSVNSPCPGKGEIIVEYPSHQNRVQIEALIGAETFFGIPYRGINN